MRRLDPGRSLESDEDQHWAPTIDMFARGWMRQPLVKSSKMGSALADQISPMLPPSAATGNPLVVPRAGENLSVW